MTPGNEPAVNEKAIKINANHPGLGFIYASLLFPLLG